MRRRACSLHWARLVQPSKGDRMDDLLDLGQGGLFIDGLDPVDLSNLDTIITEMELSGAQEREIDTTL